MASRDQLTENRLIRKVTWIGAILDLALGLGKIITGWVAQSHALIADGVHSLSDLASDGMVLLASRDTLAGPDSDHPYGHDRIQTLAAVILAVSLAVVAVGIAYSAIERYMTVQDLPVPGSIALWVAALSAISKEAIYHYTMAAARRIDSKLLRANAWHSRSDALSSIVVLVAVGGSILGWQWADIAGSVVIALMILQVAWSIGHDGIAELIDTGLDQPELDRITGHVLSVEGVKDVHDLRTRRMGASIFADLHVLVNSDISVSEGHRVGDEVHNTLRRGMPDLADIVVHIDPEDDQESRESSKLPLRGPIRSRVERCLQNNNLKTEFLQRIDLHYLSGLLNVELVLELDLTDWQTWKMHAESLARELEAYADTRKVNILIQPSSV